MSRRCGSLAATAGFAGEFAGLLRPGDCVALEGQLGAGKTTFVRSLVEALGGDPRGVSSPTFVLLHVYADATPQVYHLDAYRMHSSDELVDIGFEDLLQQGGVVLVEWASKVADILPPGTIHVRFGVVSARSRLIEIEGLERDAG